MISETLNTFFYIVAIFFIWKLFLHNSQTVDESIYTTKGPEEICPSSMHELQ